MLLEILEESQRAAREVLVAVESEHLDQPSPCEDWDVAQLINHLVGTQWYFASAITGAPLDSADQDVARGDFVAAFDAAAAKAIEAFSEPGLMQRTLDLPFGQLTGAQFLNFAALETLAHAWDVAFATDQDTDLTPATATSLLDQARRSVPPEARGGSGSAFGPERSAPAGSPPADQLAAFLGRQID